MSTPEFRPSVQPTTLTDEIIDDARRIRDLLGGALALRSPELARGAVGEAYAVASAVVDQLERSVAVAHERARTDAQAPKSIAPAVVR
jgi:hypothetical protein